MKKMVGRQTRQIPGFFFALWVSCSSAAKRRDRSFFLLSQAERESVCVVQKAPYTIGSVGALLFGAGWFSPKRHLMIPQFSQRHIPVHTHPRPGLGCLVRVCACGVCACRLSARHIRYGNNKLCLG
ncbi:hypothetical protein QBC43DRAFT_124018 [Cladorrhinum sp. PSN259]|nr:hypothetical protein QBC43DRAFT_124018 [Cladorrhinum sp. PSN259]